MDLPRLQEDIAAGRVYQHFDFLTEPQVKWLVQDIQRLQQQQEEEGGASFTRSGLSNTAYKQQGFGAQDRSICAVPWWKQSLLQSVAVARHSGPSTQASKQQQKQQQSSSSSSSERDLSHDDVDPIRQSISQKLQELRLLLADVLNRPTMKLATVSQEEDEEGNPYRTEAASNVIMAHECYYSLSPQGSLLPRHMDERHEELKGRQGWLLPSRRSLSWLIYLSDANDKKDHHDDHHNDYGGADRPWTLAENGGALRAFPQKRTTRQAKQSEQSGKWLASSQHDGNLQVGWLLGAAAEDDINITDDDGFPQPVYLNSWVPVPVVLENGETIQEPHCVLYKVTTTTKETNDESNDGAAQQARVVPITRPWSSHALQGSSVADFLKGWTRKSGLFLDPLEASRFVLLEDREEWDAGKLPAGAYIQDVSPVRGSLVIFDSVLVPHQVEPVLKGNRIALAGWFHEETQRFPEGVF